MRKNVRFLILLPALFFMGHLALGQAIFINEIHYDNVGTDVEERVEVAGPAGADLSDWSLVMYNGNGGAPYKTIILSGVLPDQQSGFGTLFFNASGLQNGSPDGIALVNEVGEVVQFLSYEGTFTAAGGPADGLLSEDIGVSEASGTTAGFSLQLAGEGSDYTDFTWAQAQTSTWAAVNKGQIFLPPVPVVFINEIHYDNSGSDTGEGVEIAGTAGTDLSFYSLVAYNGNNGEVYNTLPLNGELPNQDNGFGTLFFPVAGLQNGSPDGLALVLNETGEILQFLSYEGSFVAVGGPADGLLSEDIGVEEGSSTPANFSLQLAGEGSNYADFTWEGPLFSTYNKVNENQSFGGEVDQPEPLEVSLAKVRELPLGTVVMVSGVLTVTDEFGGPAYLQDLSGGIAVFDEQIHASEALGTGDSVRLQANLGAFNDQLQLINVTAMENFGQAEGQIVPKPATIEELSALEGELVSIQASFVKPAGLLFPGSNYQVQDESGITEIRIDDNVESLVGLQVPQGEVSITGVVGSYRGMIQLLPRFYADMPAAEPYEPAGDTIPAGVTLDVASWNMEFFGANIPDFGPADIQLQMENAARVIEALDADIIAVQEISSDSLLLVLAKRLEGNWAIRCSDVYSYSFQGPDPAFPPQKLCYLYNADIIEVLEERVVFEEFYNELRTSGDESMLPGYPTTISSFWASGRLPYQLTVNATVEGVTERISLFNIHGVSNSGGKLSYRRRLYDVQVLKDTLDTYYAGEQIIILGDYNDDVDEPVAEEVSSDFSPYEIFVEDPEYRVATLSLSEAGFRSYVFRDNMIDHLTISDELFAEWTEGSETTFIPFNLVENYSGTTSDHLPVRVRFELTEPLVVKLSGNQQVFFGYGPEECTTLTADVSGGSGEYTYRWSNGETSETAEVCPSETQFFTVVVTDLSGQSSSEEIKVCVTDVRCGNFQAKNKVELCYQPGRSPESISLCLPESLVEFFMERGASLGNCAAQDDCEVPEEAGLSSARMSTTSEMNVPFLSIDEVISVGQDFSTGRTEISFVVPEEGQSELSLYNLTGQPVKRLYKGNDTFGAVRKVELPRHSLAPGVYFLQLKTESGAVFNKKVRL